MSRLAQTHRDLLRRGFIRMEIPASVWASLSARVYDLARQYPATDLDGLLRAVYFQGVHDAAEALARSAAVVTWPDE